MPTFSQNPHIDFWPTGASITPNGDFAGGSVAAWTTSVSGGLGTLGMAGSLDRDPKSTVAGSADLTSGLVPGAIFHDFSPANLGSWPPFAAGQRFFGEAYFKLLGTSGSYGSMSFALTLRVLDSAGVYVQDYNLASKLVSGAGSDWFRLWGTKTTDSILAGQPTGARALCFARVSGAGATGGSTITWRVGEVNTYATSAQPTSLTVVPVGSTTPTTYVLPATVPDGGATTAIREAIKNLDPTEYIINES